MEGSSNPKAKAVETAARKLKHPYLLALVVAVFGIDLLVPDAIPFADEIILGLLSALLAMWRERRELGAAKKEVTPEPVLPAADGSAECPYCGRPIEAGSTKCGSCGASLASGADADEDLPE